MLFSRRAKADRADAIEAFWAWWATARGRAEMLIGGAPDDGLVAELSARVSAIHPELQWEFTAGSASTHLLVVTSAGDPALRSLAERWRRAGPTPDPDFGYASARPGNPAALTGTLQIDGNTLDLGDLRFAVSTGTPTDPEPPNVTDATAVHVAVWHPVFPRMTEQARLQVAFLALDWLLGEDAVEIWVGEITAVSEPGPSVTAARLAEIVAAMAPAAGEERWCTLAGTRRGRPLVALAQSPLKAARWPGHELHIRIDVPYRSRDENGFPTAEVLPALHALEDHIQSFADGAVVVAHETCAGIRTTHLYADRPAAAHALEPLITSWPDGRIRMTVTEDPRWEAVAHLR